MEKGAFKMQSFEEADLQLRYWKTQTPEKRLQAATLLTKAAYGILSKGFEPMEKKLTSTR